MLEGVPLLLVPLNEVVDRVLLVLVETYIFSFGGIFGARFLSGVSILTHNFF